MPFFTPRVRSGHGSSEFLTILEHAGTVLIGQLAVMAFSITDTLVAGRYNDNALAALSIGASIYVSAYISLMGVIQALLPVYAELHGAKRYTELGRSVRQSLYLAVFLILLGMSVMLHPQALLNLAQVPETLRPAVQEYLGILAWALLPAMCFRMYASLNQALGKPMFVTWLQIASLAIKIPLTLWFSFGGMGVAAMGLAGCAWATFIVNWLMLVCALVMLRTQPVYLALQLFERMEPPHWPTLAKFSRTGVPSGLSYLIEITSFTLMALFIARLGIVPSASHQIASNMTGVMYMLPLALSIACSARVSYWVGAGHAVKARTAAQLGLSITTALASLVSLTVYVFAMQIAGIYSTNLAVVVLAANMLGWVALYHWFDAIQTICAFVLRCYNVTLMPLLVYGVLLWGVGLGGGYAMAYHSGYGGDTLQTAQIFWKTGTAALAVVATLFMCLFVRYALVKPNPSSVISV